MLLGATVLVKGSEATWFSSFTPRFLLLSIAATYSVSLLFALWLRAQTPGSWLVTVQLSWDLLLTSCLVFVTGGATSGSTVLFGITVLMAAIVTGPKAARWTGIAALTLYVVLSTLLAVGVVPGPPDQATDNYRPSFDALVYALLLNVLGLGLLTLLASNLASRLSRAGGKLRIAAASARSLAQLNEDIIRSMTSGLLTLDADGRIRSANAAAAAIFGIGEGELLACRLPELIELEATPHPEGTWKIARAEGRGRKATGDRFPVGYSVSPLRGADGRSSGSLIVLEDLTEITRLRRAAERAERLATLGRLSVGLAHEIRNPLGSISGSVQLVRESPLISAEDSRLLGIVLSETERLNDLVTNMLQLGRPAQPQRVTQNLSELIDDVVDMARRGITNHKRIRIDRTDTTRNCEAIVDPAQLRQVLWNLIKNAIQASPHEGVVEVKLHHEGDERLVFEVSDQGDGVDPANTDRIFDMFYSERTHGIGVGLALAKQIVDAHDGRIDVLGADRQGATFRVTLPAKMQSAA
ncbi:MAG: ATP-binding protein [Proteobacteria bacterium]|nr:ATP-binding protein [Pseudomonadota bacterium]